MTTKANPLDVATNAVLALRKVRDKGGELIEAIADAKLCLGANGIGHSVTNESIARLEASVLTENEVIAERLFSYGKNVMVFQWKNVLRLEQEIQMLRDRVEDLKQANEEANREELP